MLIIRKGSRVLCLLFVFAGLSLHLLAQEQDLHEDVLYLKSGSVFRGKLISYDSEGMVVFQTYQGIQLGFEAPEVEKVVQEVLISKKGKDVQGNTHSFPDEKMYHYLSGGFSANYLAGGATLNIAVGYRYNRLLSLGLGTGIQNFELGYGRQMIPVYAEIRSFTTRKNISPMLAMKAGYGFAMKNESADITGAKGGALLAPEMGVRFGGRTAHFTLSLALHFQWAKFEESFDWQPSARFVDEMRYQRLEFRVGLMF